METKNFYDQLAPFYDLIYPDWGRGISHQAAQLSSIIVNCGVSPAKTVLDVSCGIGTQALGLAKLGYEVTASDLSPRAIDRAKAEATTRGISLNLSICDMREVADHHRKEFDIVFSADNSVPHLLTDADILVAFRQFLQCTRPGGICLVTVRDYEKEPLESNIIKPYAVQERNDGKYLLFQVWEVNGEHYETSMYCVRDLKAGLCESSVMRVKYYAISTGRLIGLMQDAGFVDVKRLDGVFYQPVLIGRRKE